MATHLITWIALLTSLGVAAFLGVLIWRHKEAPSGAFVVFAAFAGLPVIFLSLPEIIPQLTNYCVEVGGRKYCLAEIVKQVQRTKEKADSAQQDASRVRSALEQSVTSVPIAEKPTSATAGVSNVCRPYKYGSGYEPSPGLLVVGANKDNWFSVVASFSYKAQALAWATNLASINTIYPFNVYKVADIRGNVLYVVTLGGYLSQDEAVARVCYAEKSKISPDNPFVWASDKWGKNIRG